ncbi:hypothetical protein NP493_8305g00007 [Ridgeia piscesae]|uniref:Uncharacterized protein n=1 Tax=Ridgeia piscesae TaxID=27915 RepID=A0AAD9IQH9_RIDPI|nr:hypothetical protein NP493_8305g00007 [Ridgeia piscesae]
MSFPIDESGISIQVVVSMMSRVVSRMSRFCDVVSGLSWLPCGFRSSVLAYHSRHVCHASGCSVRQLVTCRLRHLRRRCLAFHISLPVSASWMSRVRRVGSSRRITDVLRLTSSSSLTCQSRFSVQLRHTSDMSFLPHRLHVPPIYRVYRLVSGHNITDIIYLKCRFRSSCHGYSCLTCRLITVVASQILRVTDVLSLTCRFRSASMASQSK